MLSRPQVSGPGRGSTLMAQRAHKRGADDARQKEGAAKWDREAQADTKESSKGSEDKEETVNYVPSGRLGRVHSTQRRAGRRGAAVHQEHSTRRAREQWHREDPQVRGAGRRGTRRQGWGLKPDALCAEGCRARLSRSQASRRQRRSRRHHGPCGGTGGRGWLE